MRRRRSPAQEPRPFGGAVAASGPLPHPAFFFYGVGEGTRKAATHSRVGGEPLPETATVTSTSTTTQCVLPCSRAYLSTLSLSCLPTAGSEEQLQRGGGRISPTCRVWQRDNNEEDGSDDDGTRGEHRRRKYVGCNCTCLSAVSHMLANGYHFVVSHILANGGETTTTRMVATTTGREDNIAEESTLAILPVCFFCCCCF